MYYSRAMAYSQLRDYKNAKQDLKKVMAMQPKNAKACMAMGVIYEEEGNRKAAAAYYKKASALGRESVRPDRKDRR